MSRWVSVNSEIVAALKSILPVAHDQYTGPASTYALFTTYNRIPEVSASGKYHTVGVYGDIDIFSDVDISVESSIVGSACAALETAGFVIKDVRDVDFDGFRHHVLIEFYKSKAR